MLRIKLDFKTIRIDKFYLFVLFSLKQNLLYYSQKFFCSENFCQDIWMHSFAFFFMVCITVLGHFLKVNNRLANVRVLCPFEQALGLITIP